MLRKSFPLFWCFVLVFLMCLPARGQYDPDIGYFEVTFWKVSGSPSVPLDHVFGVDSTLTLSFSMSDTAEAWVQPYPRAPGDSVSVVIANTPSLWSGGGVLVPYTVSLGSGVWEVRVRAGYVWGYVSDYCGVPEYIRVVVARAVVRLRISR